MFSADNIVWIDFEVAAPKVDLKAAGTFRYVAETSTHAIVLAYAFGNAPALTWHADGAILDWDNAPDDPRAGPRHRSDGAGRRLHPADRSRERLALSRWRGQEEGRQCADPDVLHRRC